MTWGRLQALVEALLAGDHKLTVDPEGRIGLLQYAYEEIGDLAEVLTLATSDDMIERIRQSVNGLNIKRPSLPIDDTSELAVDEGLSFALARLMASYVSKEKYGLHRAAALELIKIYNDKVYSYREMNSKYGTDGEKTYIEGDQYHG